MAAATTAAADIRTTRTCILTPGDPRVVEEKEEEAEALEANSATEAKTTT